MPDLQHAATDDGAPEPWATATVADDLTHHLLDGQPLYDRRFDAVQKFHAPGLAPVRDAYGAYHIRPSGVAAYHCRFVQTWGFYEGRAAVEAEDGWLHILTDGSPLCEGRFDWCGNFQEGRCTVRFSGGSYGHIGADGRPVYQHTHLYAGDFRDGVAVVRYAEDGLCGHIDDSGRAAHAHRYLDLDVFHKGFARAQDEMGWFHIRRDGTAAYKPRFRAVEPFYNGQARVLTHDGEYQVIDIGGRSLLAVGSTGRDRFHQVSADLVGYWRSETIAQAVQLGLFDHLPADESRLATAVNIPEKGLLRLLGALWELGFVEPTDTRDWYATRTGRFLTSTHTPSLFNAALQHTIVHRDDWKDLGELLRRDGARPSDAFNKVALNPDGVRVLHNMLTAYAQHDYSPLVHLFPFDNCRLILDVGGGLGALGEMLSTHFPQSEVCVMERPEVCELATSMRSNKPLRFIPGDFFKQWPMRPDAFVMARVLHDWDDEQALQILRTARQSTPSGCVGIVVELLLHPHSAFGRLCDLHLLVATGGRERTAEEYAELAASAGFQVREIRQTSGIMGLVILEAK